MQSLKEKLLGKLYCSSTEWFQNTSKKKSIYIPADKFGIWIVPPLIVKKEEIDFLVDSVDEAFGTLRKHFEREFIGKPKYWHW